LTTPHIGPLLRLWHFTCWWTYSRPEYSWDIDR